MHAAELVQLMVDLVEDEGLVIVGSVVLHDVIHWEGERDRKVRKGSYPCLSCWADLWGCRGHAGPSGRVVMGNWVNVPAFGTKKFTTSILSK